MQKLSETHLFYHGYVDPDFGGAFDQLVEYQGGFQVNYTDILGTPQVGWQMPKGISQGLKSLMAISGFQWAFAVKTEVQNRVVWDWTMRQEGTILARVQVPLNDFDPRPLDPLFSNVLNGQCGVLHSYHATLSKYEQGLPIHHQQFRCLNQHSSVCSGASGTRNTPNRSPI